VSGDNGELADTPSDPMGATVPDPARDTATAEAPVKEPVDCDATTCKFCAFSAPRRCGAALAESVSMDKDRPLTEEPAVPLPPPPATRVDAKRGDMADAGLGPEPLP
jgi:hypothetical protein